MIIDFVYLGVDIDQGQGLYYDSSIWTWSSGPIAVGDVLEHYHVLEGQSKEYFVLRREGPMLAEQHDQTQGDTLTKLTAVLKQKGTDGALAAVDLSGKTVKFAMADDDGVTVVPPTNATVVDADNGIVQYDFQAADVDESGVFWGWFIVYSLAGEIDTFPGQGRKFRIVIAPSEARS